jgi:hypothetical protein
VEEDQFHARKALMNLSGFKPSIGVGRQGVRRTAVNIKIALYLSPR